MVGTTGGAGTAAASGSAGAISASGGRGGTASGVAGQAAGAAGSPLTAGGTGGNASAGSGGTAMLPNAGAPAAGGGADGPDDCGQGGTMGKASNAGGAQGRGNGNTQFTLSAGNQILRLWPGLEPIQGSPNYSPIGTGVLQPVLTWGGSCAPGSPPTRTGTNWWISAQYVNTLGSEPKHKGCYGGPVMNVEIGDQLLIDMSLKGTVWNQTITSQKSGKSVAFDMDMAKQEQRWALFEIEMPTSTRPAADVVFTNTVITFEKPEPKACQPNTRGANDYYSTPISSSDGLRCCVARLVLRAQGVAATTMDP
jgi:hypothetical protein